MHESTGRTINSSSLLISNANRSLNVNPPKLTRSLPQDNATKKLKVNHGNGVKPTIGGNSTVRSLLHLSIVCLPFLCLLIFSRFEI
jgi:hypothetical protein